MNPFLKSSEPDLKKLFKLLETIHKNVLYLTYQTDKVRRDITAMQTDKGLQKQVDSYFEDDESRLGYTTPPQTDPENIPSDAE